MYSKNDFRYYKGGLFLAHYGVKGMKWGKHKFLNDQLAAQMNALQPKTPMAVPQLNTPRTNTAAGASTQPRSYDNAKAQHGISGASPSDTYGKEFMRNNPAKTSSSKDASGSPDTEKINQVVDSVINGKYGNGNKRVDALTKEGYDYGEIQNLVNEKLGSSVRHEVNKEMNAGADSSEKPSTTKKKSSKTGKKKKGSKSSKKKSSKKKMREAVRNREQSRRNALNRSLYSPLERGY